MGFFQTIKSSIYSPEFYSKIKDKSLGSILKYFFLLILLLAILNTLILSYELTVKIPGEVKNFIVQTINAFPPDLVVEIDKGHVTTNAQEPFFIPFPSFEGDMGRQNLNNVLVIDTKTPFSSAQFNQYKTLFWLTKDSFFYENREFDTRSIDLSNVDNIKIDYNFVQDLTSKIYPWLNVIGPILIFAVLLGLFIGFSFKLIYFFILAVLIFFLSSIFKWGLNYYTSYKTVVYASTLGLFVDFILFNTGAYTGFYGFPLLFTLTSLCVATVNLQNYDKRD